MNVGIIGAAGLIGKQRLKSLEELKQMGYIIDNIYLYDIVPIVSDKYVVVENLEEMQHKNLDLLIISVPHDRADKLARIFIPSGFRILVEKPLGMNFSSARTVVRESLYKNQVYVGFNYRFFEGVERLFQDFYDKKLGKCHSVVMELGHGGSPKDYDSWKTNPSIVGIGAILDPGIHFIDLINQFDKSINPISIANVRDSAGFILETHVLLKGKRVGIVNFQTSLVRWQNTFKIQFNGSEATGIVTGRGGNYGIQTYKRIKKWGWVDGDYVEDVLESDCKNSFTKELESILFNKKYPMSPCVASENANLMEIYRRILHKEIN